MGATVIDIDGPFDVVDRAVLVGRTLPRSPPVPAPVRARATAITRGPARTSAPYGAAAREVEWARLGSNQRPTDYESAALTD